MYGIAKQAALRDPLKTGYGLEAPGSRTLDDRQERGVVFSGETEVGDHDSKYA